MSNTLGVRVVKALSLPYEAPFDGGEIVRAARHTINSDIEKLEGQIRNLKRRHNELSIVYVIPPELLAKIFAFLRDLHKEYFIDQPVHIQAQWMRVGHVCHHWREVALGCPALWSAPIFANPELAEEMLKRSKVATLTVNAVLSYRNWSTKNMDQLENTLIQPSRIRALNIHFRTGSSSEGLVKMLTSFIDPAPFQLETVSFTTQNNCSPSMMNLPVEAFEQATSLHSLELHRVGLTWQSGLFKHRGLTKLCLQSVPPSGFVQMFDVLENMPQLRILELLDSLPLVIPSEAEPRVLTFKDLERLEVSSVAPSCAAFLSHIKIPANARVNLFGRASRPDIGGSPDLEVYFTIISVIGQMMKKPAGNNVQEFHTFRSVSLAFSITNEVRLDMYKGKELKGDPLVTILFSQVYAYLPQSTSERLWKDIFTHFNLSEVQHFKLVCSSVADLTFKETIAKLPKLSTLELCGDTMDLFRAIGEDWDSSKTSLLANNDNYHSLRKMKSDLVFPSPTLFTSLKTVKILEGNFRRNDWFNLELYINILMQRCNMNAPIERLVIDFPDNLQDWKLKLLTEVVPEVVVDGMEVNPDELDSEEEYTDSSEEESEEEFDYMYDGGGWWM